MTSARARHRAPPRSRRRGRLLVRMGLRPCEARRVEDLRSPTSASFSCARGSSNARTDHPWAAAGCVQSSAVPHDHLAVNKARPCPSLSCPALDQLQRLVRQLQAGAADWRRPRGCGLRGGPPARASTPTPRPRRRTLGLLHRVEVLTSHVLDHPELQCQRTSSRGRTSAEIVSMPAMCAARHDARRQRSGALPAPRPRPHSTRLPAPWLPQRAG